MKSHIGLIGYGNMGQFIAKYLRKHFVLHIYDPNAKSDKASENVSLADAASQPVVVLAMPVQRLESVLQKIQPHIQEGTLVLDICSVKVVPMQLMQKYLPANASYIGTHPIFGPQSGRYGIGGLQVAVCKGRVSQENYESVIQFLHKQLKLKVIECSAVTHDKEMAYGLALTHLISRTFQAMDIPALVMPTKSYELMLAIKKNLSKDSLDLLITIQNYNPYAKAIRKKFVAEIEKLEDKFEKKAIVE